MIEGGGGISGRETIDPGYSYNNNNKQ